MKKKLDPLQHLSKLMNALPNNSKELLVTQLKQRNVEIATEIAEVVSDAILPLNAICQLRSNALQKLYRAVDKKIWLRALKIAEPEVKEHLLNHLSTRARADLEDDLRSLGPVRLSEAQEAERQIMGCARDLVKSGEISGLDHNPNDPWVE